MRQLKYMLNIRSMKRLLLIQMLFFISIDGTTAREFSSADCPATLVFDAYTGNKSQIVTQAFRNGKWGMQSTVFESAKEHGFNPVVASDKLGNSLIVWPSNQNGKTSIRFRISDADGNWNDEADDLIQASGEQTTPAILSDFGNNIWLAWASDENGFDDIFLTRWNDGKWSTPEQVNQVNKVPDIVPSLSREDGNIVVTWSYYDPSINNYVKQRKVVSSYIPPSQNAVELSDYCSLLDYSAQPNNQTHKRSYLDKTKVIKNDVPKTDIPVSEN